MCFNCKVVLFDLFQMEGQDPSTMSSDERWLLFLMKGKIMSKKKKPLEESLVRALHKSRNTTKERRRFSLILCHGIEVFESYDDYI